MVPVHYKTKDHLLKGMARKILENYEYSFDELNEIIWRWNGIVDLHEKFNNTEDKIGISIIKDHKSLNIYLSAKLTEDGTFDLDNLFTTAEKWGCDLAKEVELKYMIHPPLYNFLKTHKNLLTE